MNRFDKFVGEDKGYTLIELVVALSIFSLILGTIYAVINFGFSTYDRVTVENSLRDEGDIVMSAIMSEFYAIGAEHAEIYPAGDGKSGIILDGKDANFNPVRRLILIDTNEHKAYIRNYNEADNTKGFIEIKSLLVTDSTISIANCENGCNSGLIDITLNLQQSSRKKDYTLTLKSQFGF